MWQKAWKNRIEWNAKGLFPFLLFIWLADYEQREIGCILTRKHAHTHTQIRTHTHTRVCYTLCICVLTCAYQNSWQYLISSWAFTHTRSNIYMIRNIHFHICVYIDMVAVFRSSRSAHTAPAHSHAHDAKGKNSRKKFPKVKSQLNLPNQHD